MEAEKIDGVDTATGHLMFLRNDLSLEGTGGMDFELNRYYDSNEANLGHPTVEYLDEIEVDTIWVHFKTADGSDYKIIVSTVVLKNHKKALKDLLVSYTKGKDRKRIMTRRWEKYIFVQGIISQQWEGFRQGIVILGRMASR